MNPRQAPRLTVPLAVISTKILRALILLIVKYRNIADQWGQMRKPINESNKTLVKVDNLELKEVYKRGQQSSQVHRLTEIRSLDVVNNGYRRSEEDGRHQRSRSKPGATGAESTHRKC